MFPLKTDNHKDGSFLVKTNNDTESFPTLRKARQHQKIEVQKYTDKKVNYESTISFNGQILMFRSNDYQYGRV